MTDNTSLSLIDQLRRPGAEERWQEFFQSYAAWMKRWLRHFGVSDHSADDITQEVMCVVLRKLPTFEHNGRPGAFRHWLKTIVILQLRKYRRSPSSREEAGQGQVAELAEQLEADASAASLSWNQEESREMVRVLLNKVASGFQPRSVEAFRRVVIDQQETRVVAEELGMTVNAVTVARSKIMRALREVGEGLL